MAEHSPDGLSALEAALARDFEWLNHPPNDWMPARPGPDGEVMADVAIVGAGMCGLAAAFALRRLGLRGEVDLTPIPTRPPSRVE